MGDRHRPPLRSGGGGAVASGGGANHVRPQGEAAAALPGRPGAAAHRLSAVRQGRVPLPEAAVADADPTSSAAHTSKADASASAHTSADSSSAATCAAAAARSAAAAGERALLRRCYVCACTEFPSNAQYSGCWVGHADVAQRPRYYDASIVGGARLTNCTAAAFPINTSGKGARPSQPPLRASVAAATSLVRPSLTRARALQTTWDCSVRRPTRRTWPRAGRTAAPLAPTAASGSGSRRPSSSPAAGSATST